MASKFPQPGEIFEGIYKIDRILGAGGFARIYKGIEAGIGREVALKLLRPPLRTDQSDTQRDKYLKTVTERFQREAVMLSKLKSPHTVTMFSYGQSQSGLLYMVLEFIDGQTLTELRRNQEHVEPHRIAAMLKQVLISLKEAHAMGMLHRDLKPGNIMIYEHLGVPDQIKLLDFGIAKLIGDASKDHSEDLTSDGTLIGTPRYMAPEQIQGKPVGPASDLYSLGLVAYELCVGKRAIEGDSSIQIIGQQLAPDSVVLPEDSNLPRRLEAIINKMMEKDCDQRYQNADEILADLDNPKLLDYIAEGEIASIETTLEHLSSNDLIEIDDYLEPKSRLVFLGAIVAIILMGVGAFALLHGEDTEVEKKAPIVSNKIEEVKKEVKVKIIAKSRGKEVIADIFIDGINRGYTRPLFVPQSMIENSKVVAKYTDPDTGEKLESKQDVTSPRDVTFEFEPKIARNGESPLNGDIVIPEKDEKVAKKKSKKEQRKKRVKPKEKVEKDKTTDLSSKTPVKNDKKVIKRTPLINKKGKSGRKKGRGDGLLDYK